MAIATAVRLNEPKRKKRPYRGFAHSVWWFVLPAAALYLFAVVYPSVRGSLFAFTDWDGVSPDPSWVGFEQFTRIWSDPNGVTAIVNTLLIAFAVTVIQNAVGLLIALAVNSRIKSRNVLRVLIFAPVVITTDRSRIPLAEPLHARRRHQPVARGDRARCAPTELAGKSRHRHLVDHHRRLLAVRRLLDGDLPRRTPRDPRGDPARRPPSMGRAPIRRFWSVVRPLLAPAITINVMLSLIGGLEALRPGLRDDRRADPAVPPTPSRP